MDNIRETKEPQKQPERRIILLNEDFHPFDPRESETHIEQIKYSQQTPYSFDMLNTSISLATEEKIPVIPLNIGLETAKARYGTTITPFYPELGYQIDSEDLNLESRITKAKRLSRELEKEIDFSKNPFLLYIKADEFSLYKSNILKKRPKPFLPLEKDLFPEETLKLLKRLRVLVRLPKGSFETKPSNLSLVYGAIRFIDFYPTDTGPLPTNNDPLSFLQEGFSLQLPDEPDKFTQISMRFILAEEESLPDRRS